MTTPDITTRLQEALKPFADLADYIDAERPTYARRGMEVQIEGWPYTLSVEWLYDAREAMTSPGWQGIETAPKDGTEVDLWVHVLHGGSPRRVPDCAWKHLADGPDWYTRGDRGWEALGAIWLYPSNWMPLPATPSQIGEGKDHG